MENQSDMVVEMMLQTPIPMNANANFIFVYNNADRIEMQVLSKVAPLAVHCSNSYSSSSLPTPPKSYDVSSLPYVVFVITGSDTKTNLSAPPPSQWGGGVYLMQ
jgi:hypothetical protein